MAQQKTHGFVSNGVSAWLSEFREELPGFLDNYLGKMGESVNDLPPTEYVIVYRLSPGADQWEPPEFDEYIQAGGRHDCMTVELRLREGNGFTLFTIGRPAAASESLSETVDVAGDPVPVCASEVLDSAEATTLFEYFYDHHALAPGWHARPSLWFDANGAPIDAPPATANTDVSSATSAVVDGNPATDVRREASSANGDADGSEDSTRLNL